MRVDSNSIFFHSGFFFFHSRVTKSSRTIAALTRTFTKMQRDITFCSKVVCSCLVTRPHGLAKISLFSILMDFSIVQV